VNIQAQPKHHDEPKHNRVGGNSPRAHLPHIDDAPAAAAAAAQKYQWPMHNKGCLKCTLGSRVWRLNPSTPPPSLIRQVAEALCSCPAVAHAVPLTRRCWQRPPWQPHAPPSGAPAPNTFAAGCPGAACRQVDEGVHYTASQMLPHFQVQIPAQT
jgi:hypothetical protein